MRRLKILLLLSFFNSIIITSLYARITWVQATNSAAWSARYGHASVVYDNKMWVMGGDAGGPKNDVWYSTDGITWTQATASAEWSERFGSTSIVYNNKMWVIGGWGYNVELNDVWYSTDGITWTQATASAPWSAGAVHTSIVYDNKMWVIGGGMDAYPYTINDVWYSTDGTTWTQATGSAAWSARCAHASVVYDNKMWVMGGLYNSASRIGLLNDIWYSTNGVNWFQATGNAWWTVRAAYASVIFDNKMWVLGGCTNWSDSCINDVWQSSNGDTWVQMSDAEWIPKFYHTSVVFNNKIWVIGGAYYNSGWIYLNDVWYSTGLGIEESKIDSQSFVQTNGVEIFPNPAKSLFTIRIPRNCSTLNSQSSMIIKIFDASGKLVKEIASATPRNDNTVQVSLKGIKPGVYFVRVGNEMVTKKLVITK